MATIEELQQQVAALSAQVAAITAPPTDYYTSQYDGEEIDAAVTAALTPDTVPTDGSQKLITSGAVKGSVAVLAPLTMLPTRNLLDNWYFGNPVNQRGNTQYTGAGAAYFIDRWKCGGYNQTIELTQQGLRLNSNTGIWLTQPIENYDDLVGKVVTVSALIDSVLYSATGTVSKTGSIATRTPSDVYLEVTHGEKGVRFVTYSANTQQVSILAAKLELGSQQTLAHQGANGNWVLNEIPNYADTLARCQRYFQTFATESLRPTDALDFRPVTRANPALSTITVDGKTLYTASADL